MKIKRIMTSFLVILIFMTLSINLSAKLPKSKAQELCNKMKKSGIQCKISKLRNCGRKWKRVKRFKGRGRNYSVCVPGNRFKEAMKKAGEKIKKVAKKVRNAANTLSLLVNAYKIYFAVVGRGVRKHRLPGSIINRYQKYYKVSLRKIKYGDWNKGPGKAAAITDCYTIYFKPGYNMHSKISSGKFTDDWYENLLLHELVHCEQCKRKGGRNNYAKMWFGNLPISLIKNIKKKFSDFNIHSRMPMEQEAKSRASQIQRKASAERKK